MAIRIGIIGTTERECSDGLALLDLLADHGVTVDITQRPAQIASDQWIARANTTAPDHTVRG
ncbi:hypothetical protein OG875_04920 [Streptomyces sp. NBC_01498]|uniref:hypothetical protein n=1 Tax=Streptomyces sp. NBC_01498 TaxID=2975870 RepID=UPI002E7B44E8|nr:hypothetical protein [Streptomyces sp. NBC_01498]WTL23999.1 hypothetical protein OG875_04920 [Streptomyces sp. NBC_01498]